MLQPDRGVALLRNAKTAQLRRPFRPVTRRVVRASVPAEMKIRWSTDPDIAERQMQAVIFCLVAFGYIDNDFDPAERQLVHGLIAQLVDDRAAAIADDSVRSDVTARWTKHYADVMDEMDRDIMCHFTESVCEGESTTDFVIAKLKLGCFELLKGFEDADRSALLDAIDELMHADGIIHPNEQSFRQDLAQLLVAPVELDDAEVVAIEEGKIAFGGVASLVPEVDDHPLPRTPTPLPPKRRVTWRYCIGSTRPSTHSVPWATAGCGACTMWRHFSAKTHSSTSTCTFFSRTQPVRSSCWS